MSTVTDRTFAEMKEFLDDPLSRIVDSRMLEFSEKFSFTLQLLHTDGSISQCEVKPKFIPDTHDPDLQRIASIDQFRRDALDIFRLQYRHSPRMNPALYGLLDAADAESRVEQTLPIQSR